MTIFKKLLAYTALAIFCSTPVLASDLICIYKDGTRYTIPEAVQYHGGQADYIKFCCESLGCNSAPVNAKGERLAHIAAKYKRDLVLKYFIEELDLIYDIGDLDGVTPLMLAAVSGSVKTTQVLLDNSAKLLTKDKAKCDVLCYAKKAVKPEAGLLELVQKAWNRASGISAAETRRNTDDLMKILAKDDFMKSLKGLKITIEKSI